MTWPSHATLYPRLQRAAQMAAQFLIDSGVTHLPVNPKALIRKCGWGLKKYSSIVKQSPLVSSIDELIEALKSQDAVTIHTHERDTIVYNDTLPFPERIRFSLCHEIGHLILEHFVEYDLETLSPEDIAVLEQEANVFAANLLCPVGVMEQLRKPYLADYRKIFGLSKQAWELRLRSFALDRTYVDPNVRLQHKQLFHNFMYTRACPHCHTQVISSEQQMCPHCDSQRLCWKPDTVQLPETNITILYPPDIPPEPPTTAKPTPVQSSGTGTTQTFPWTAGSWSQFTFACMAESDRRLKAAKAKKGKVPFWEDEYFGENHMVLDDLWQPSQQNRRKQNGKRRAPSSNS